MYTKVPGRLRELHKEGYSPFREYALMRYEVVVFSNQSRITFDVKGKLFPQWKQKLQAIAETVYPRNP